MTAVAAAAAADNGRSVMCARMLLKCYHRMKWRRRRRVNGSDSKRSGRWLRLLSVGGDGWGDLDHPSQGKPLAVGKRAALRWSLLADDDDDADH